MNNNYLKAVLVLSLLLFSLVSITGAAPGDSQEEAEEIFLGETTGELTSSADRHYFIFDADPNVSIMYDIELYGPSNTDFDMLIEDGDGNYVTSEYGGSYPESASVGGHDILAIEVYSVGGSGEFTLEITEREVKPGDTRLNPIQLELGDNPISFEETGSKFLEFDPENGTYYNFDVILQDETLSAEMYLSSDQGSSHAHNSTTDNDYQRSASLYGAQYNITGDIYVNIESPTTPIVRISEVSAPDGDDPDNPIELNVDVSRNVYVFEGIRSYFSFVIEDEEYYSIQIEGLNGSGYGSLIISNSISNQNFNINSHRTTYFQSTPGNHTLELLSEFASGNITITLSRDAPPLGYSRDNPLPLGETEISTKLFGNSIYLQPEVEQGSSYFLNWATVSGDDVDLEFRFEGIRNIYSYSRGSENSIFFYAGSAVITIQLITWNQQFAGNISLSLEPTNNPDHVSIDDAKIASVGSNSGEIQYLNQPFWFEFTAPEDQLYSFDLKMSIYKYAYIELISTSGLQLGWGSSDSGIEYTADQDEVLYILIFGSSSTPPDSFTLDIYEGELREETIDRVYSQNLQAGDYFEWGVETYYNGEPIGDSSDPNGGVVNLEVLTNGPIISENENEYDYFQVTDNTDTGFADLYLILLPVEIREGGTTIATSQDIIMDRFGFYGAEITESNGQLIYSNSQSNGEDSFNLEVIYDAEDMFLISLDFIEEYSDDRMELHFDLTDSRISGPPENIEENDPPLQLPLPIYSAMFAIVMLPIIRKKIL